MDARKTPNGARYGMVVDLDKCNGCGACAVACAVENNVPPAASSNLPGLDFVAPVKSRAEARASQTKALFAANELQGAKDQLGECAKLEELQSLLVRSWREELRPE